MFLLGGQSGDNVEPEGDGGAVHDEHGGGQVGFVLLRQAIAALPEPERRHRNGAPLQGGAHL